MANLILKRNGVACPDFAVAQEFLSTLDPDATEFTFQFFGDLPQCMRKPKIIHCSLKTAWPRIVALNNPEYGMGVFVCVNKTDGRGRRVQNVTKVRALFADADSQAAVAQCTETIQQTGITPTMTVTTSPGRAHYYWCVSDLELGEFSASQSALSLKCASDPSVKDLPRVMRLPGTLHLKDPGSPHLVTLEKASARRRYDSGALIRAFGLSRTDQPQPRLPSAKVFPFTPSKSALGATELRVNRELGAGLSTNIREIESAVMAIPPSAVASENDWKTLAMGLAHEAALFEEQAEELWGILDRKSRQAENYDAEDNRIRWDRYRASSQVQPHPVTIGTVFALAKKHGWPGWRPAVTEVGNTAPGPGGRPRHEFPLIKACDFENLPAPTYLVDGLLPKNGLAVLYGPSGSLKTFLALDFAASVAAGVPALGQYPVEQGAVVYACAEAPSAVARKRWPAWSKHRNVTADKLPLVLIPRVPNVSEPRQAELFIATIKEAGIQPKLVVIDTVARAMPGLDENNASDVGKVVQAFERISMELDCAVLALHHSGKDEARGMRGSTALAAAADVIFKVKRPPDSMVVSLACEKMKDADEPANLWVEARPVGDSLVLSVSSAAAYISGSRATPPVTPQDVLKALTVLGAINGAQVTTSALATAILPANPPSRDVAAMERRLRRGAKLQLAAYAVCSSGRGRAMHWTVPSLKPATPIAMSF